MAGTIEDRRFPDGVYFGQTEVARRSFNIFVTSIEEFLAELGAEAPPTLSRRLATAILSAAHGVISLPLGTPTMKWQNVRGNGAGDRQFAGRMDHELEAPRKTSSWPTVSINTLLRPSAFQ